MNIQFSQVTLVKKTDPSCFCHKSSVLMYTGLFLSSLFYSNVYLSIFARLSRFPLTPVMKQYLGSSPSVSELIRIHAPLAKLNPNVSLINLTVNSAAKSHFCPPQNQQPSPGEKYPHIHVL